MLGLGAQPSSSDQQAVEALAMLIALRTWSPTFRDPRISLAVRTDNIATLRLVAKMQPHSPQLGMRVSLLPARNGSRAPCRAGGRVTRLVLLPVK